MMMIIIMILRRLATRGLAVGPGFLLLCREENRVETTRTASALGVLSGTISEQTTKCFLGGAGASGTDVCDLVGPIGAQGRAKSVAGHVIGRRERYLARRA
eukprot:2458658-Rhodomonas_salina.2